MQLRATHRYRHHYCDEMNPPARWDQRHKCFFYSCRLLLSHFWQLFYHLCKTQIICNFHSFSEATSLLESFNILIHDKKISLASSLRSLYSRHLLLNSLILPTHLTLLFQCDLNISGSLLYQERLYVHHQSVSRIRLDFRDFTDLCTLCTQTLTARMDDAAQALPGCTMGCLFENYCQGFS